MAKSLYGPSAYRAQPMRKGDLSVLYRFARHARRAPALSSPLSQLASRLASLASFASFAIGLAVLVAATPAHADGKTEGAAKALEAKAMQEDYLATEFDKALEKLNQASSKCGEKCSSIVRAQIKRDIGVVQIAKANHEAAVAAFTEALKADSNVALDPDTRTKDVDSAWAEAKKQAASGGGSAGGPPPAGDFTLQPAPETLVRTPLDVYGEYGGTETLTKVVLKYKAFGMTEWKTVEMKSMDKGWGAEIPCVDVIQGDILYYVQGFNANNDPVATSGDRNNPFHTTVKRASNAELPHFPGKEPPRQCQDAGDCPPDFPGCKKPVADDANATTTEDDSSLKDEGTDCEEDSECKSGTCGGNKTCKGGSKGPKRRKFWLGVDLAYDFVNLPSGTDVCALQTGSGSFTGPNPGSPVPQANNYYCTSSGTDFPGNAKNDSLITPGQSDKVSPGGFAPGNFRAMVSFDYAATPNFMLGVRFGYVFNGYNGTFASKLPIHAELRATYVIGKKPLDTSGLSPYIMIAGGVSQYSAEVGVTAISTGAGCAANPKSCTEYAQAWNIGGPGFASLGAGIRYAFTPSWALLFGPRLTAAFGSLNTLIAISPELAVQYGF
jgi:hypothetical protein